MKKQKCMTLKKFLVKASKTCGEVRTDPSDYPALPCKTRLPDWVRALIEEAWAGGLEEGKLQERYMTDFNAMIARECPRQN
jgi:hypothetical protein